MKNKNLLLIGLSTMLIVNTMNAQQVTSGVLQKFTPSVVSRVYHVTKKLQLSAEDQLQLAKAYETEDSLISNALKAGTSLDDIKGTKAASQIAHFDSLMEQQKVQEKGQVYIQSKINELQQIKELTTEQQQQITNLFLALCQSGEYSHGEALKKTLPLVLKDTIYYAGLYKAEIRQLATQATNTYPAKNDLPIQVLLDCRDEIKKYQQALITIDYAYPVSDRDKMHLLKSVNQYYKPLLDSVLTRYGYLNVQNRVSWALRLQKVLKLSDTQVQQLMIRAGTMSKLEKEFLLKNPYESFGSGETARKFVMEILTEDQYRTFLQLRYQQRSEEQATTTWKEMAQYGLTSGLDSIPVYRNLSFYYVDKMVINDMYREKTKEKDARLADVELFKPEPLKKLELARQKAKDEARKEKENAKKEKEKQQQNTTVKTKPNTNFVW